MACSSGGLLPLAHLRSPQQSPHCLRSQFVPKWSSKCKVTSGFATLKVSRRRIACSRAGLGPELVEHLHGLVLGVGVGLPCTVMECGDVVYRSTLPRQGWQITTPGVALTLLIVTYLWATPGECCVGVLWVSFSFCVQRWEGMCRWMCRGDVRM